MRSADETANEVRRKIDDDPTIEGAEHISTFASKKGFGPFKKAEIHLQGVVRSESDKRKAEEHARHSAASIPIVNEIEIQRK